MRTSNVYNCEAQMLFSMRAPAGQLQDTDRLFRVIRSTIRLDPAWLSRVTQVAGNVAAVEQKGAMDRAAIVRKNSQDINKIITEGYERRSKVQDQSFEQFDQTIRGVQTYRNPSTGESFELSNQYNHAWMNGVNEYILTDNPNFNPNGKLNGNWTSMQPVQH
jgi:nucleoid DNA-binding protein